VHETAPVDRFYEDAYSLAGAQAESGGRWRALSAAAKADHVIELCAVASIEPGSVVEVGCGDGAVLAALHSRSFAKRLCGFEISAAAVAIAQQRSELDAVTRFDGAHLPVADRTFDLAILSHVLEHVADPVALLRETARTAHAVIVEVPLEANLSARRKSKRDVAAGVGHIQSLDRAALAAIIDAAALRSIATIDDPLPRAVHRFAASTRAARARGDLKWAVRRSLTSLSAPLAARLFTLHRAELCVDRDDAG
jgi:SAM-dependent methyltransferase